MCLEFIAIMNPIHITGNTVTKLRAFWILNALDIYIQMKQHRAG